MEATARAELFHRGGDRWWRGDADGDDHGLVTVRVHEVVEEFLLAAVVLKPFRVLGQQAGTTR